MFCVFPALSPILCVKSQATPTPTRMLHVVLRTERVCVVVNPCNGPDSSSLDHRKTKTQIQGAPWSVISQLKMTRQAYKSVSLERRVILPDQGLVNQPWVSDHEGPIYLVTEHGAQVSVNVHSRQRSLPGWVKLTEPVQCHHGLQGKTRVQMSMATVEDIHSRIGLMSKEDQRGLVDETKHVAFRRRLGDRS